jgi:D-glycero-D-manno-heptose 1,7-bisphosphate phosphatase
MIYETAHLIRLADIPRRGVAALFLDRDGTLIDDPGYIADPAKVRLLAGAAGALKRFRDAGCALVIVTNQSGIGRGLYSLADYEAVSARLRDLLAAEGVELDAELACAHAPEEGDACGWRKPSAGMILEAGRLLDLDLGRSVLAGDKLSDLQAAAAARLSRAVHVLTGHGRSERAAVLAWKSPIALDLADDLSTLSPCES